MLESVLTTLAAGGLEAAASSSCSSVVFAQLMQICWLNIHDARDASEDGEPSAKNMIDVDVDPRFRVVYAKF